MVTTVSKRYWAMKAFSLAKETIQSQSGASYMLVEHKGT